MLEIGKTAAIVKEIKDADVRAFAELTGDKNPIHLDDDNAAKSVFGRRIAHGLYVGSMIGEVIGTVLPGRNTIYLEQTFRFLKPVYIGDVCRAEICIGEAVKPEKGIYKLDTAVINQNGELVIDGYAVVKYADTGMNKNKEG